MVSLLRALDRVDRAVAGLEVVLLCLLAAALAAGGLGLVTLQNHEAEELPGLATSLKQAAAALAAGGVLLYLTGWARSRTQAYLKEWGVRALVIGGVTAMVWLSLYLEHALDVLLRTLVLWIGVVGASLATRSRKHITIEALDKLLPPAARRWGNAAIALSATLLLVVLCRVSWQYLVDSRAQGAILLSLRAYDLDVPKWWAQAILPAGLAVMAWRFLLIFFEAISGRGPAGAISTPPVLEHPHDESTAAQEEQA